MPTPDNRHPRVSGLCDDPACDCRRVFSGATAAADLWLTPEMDFGVLADEPHSVLTECLFCEEMIETPTGLKGVAEMEKAGWEAVSGLDWACPSCSAARAEIVGEEG